MRSRKVKLGDICPDCSDPLTEDNVSCVKSKDGTLYYRANCKRCLYKKQREQKGYKAKTYPIFCTRDGCDNYLSGKMLVIRTYKRTLADGTIKQGTTRSGICRKCMYEYNAKYLPETTPRPKKKNTVKKSVKKTRKKVLAEKPIIKKETPVKNKVSVDIIEKKPIENKLSRSKRQMMEVFARQEERRKRTLAEKSANMKLDEIISKK